MDKFGSKDIKATLRGGMVHLLKRYVGPFRARRRWLESTQWYSSQELKELQFKLLRRVVKHAYETVPYYTHLMRKLKLKPNDIKTLEDIRKFPTMCKANLKKAGNDLVSQKFNRFFS